MNLHSTVSAYGDHFLSCRFRRSLAHMITAPTSATVLVKENAHVLGGQVVATLDGKDSQAN